MIRHLVLLNVNAGVKQALFAALEGLKSRSVDFRSGPNVCVEPGMDKGFMKAFWIDFASVHVRDAYLVDQEHPLTGGRIVSSTVGGTGRVIVVGIGI